MKTRRRELGHKVAQMLRECGAILVREKKHVVWRLPNNRMFITCSSPSDSRGERNQIRDLRKMLAMPSGVERGR